jgi:UDP-2-acetamido-3-amino-2,3-dideoxy-glucuronate N-acetyltransferase
VTGTPVIHATADVSDQASIGDGTVVWSLAQIREHATVGRECIIGRAAYVDHDVRIGDRVKVQNLAQIYHPAEIGDGAFIGPAAILTNDQFPRAVTPDGSRAGAADWTPVGVTLREGASIGANAVCVAPVVVGRWAMVAAGATVIHDVQDFALVAGTPARFIGWVGPAGRRLVKDGNGWICPVTGTSYSEADGSLQEATR